MRIPLFLLPLALLLGQSAPAPLENEYVRVVMAVDKPKPQAGAPHGHDENRVMVYLDAGDMRIVYPDGRVDNQHWRAGDVAWSPADASHTSQNLSANPIRIVEIELRKGGAGVDTKPGAYDTIDNAQVHVTKSSRPPAAGIHYVAVDPKTGAYLWDKIPEGRGPFVIAELK